MHNTDLIWRERKSDSNFIDSIWRCTTSITATRTALADLCVSIVFIQEEKGIKVILRGPETKPRTELLVAGWPHMAIRLRLGVSLKGFPTQDYINRSLVISAGTTSSFLFNNARLSFPDFGKAEQLIEQLDTLDFISHEISYEAITQAAQTLSPRNYAQLVKRTIGVSPYSLYQNQRAHEALRLIKLGVPLAAVATDLDFVDQPHLTRISKQFFGHTPKQLLSLPHTS